MTTVHKVTSRADGFGNRDCSCGGTWNDRDEFCSSLKQEKSEGLKFDRDKPKMDLLCPFAIEELSKVLTFGAKKYASWNWAKGIKTSRLIAAALRHTFAYARGEDRDPETGLHHMAHAMCCCMFIIGMPHYVDGQDDRLLRKDKTK